MTYSLATQIKVTLPQNLYLHLKSKAEKFDLGLATYIKHLVINDVKNIDIPVFRMSKEREEIALKALRDHKAGKTKEIKNIDQYFDSLL
jgi:hypothetical protein